MFENVLVGADSTITAARAVRYAAELVEATGATLHVVTVFPPNTPAITTVSGNVVHPADVLLEQLRIMLEAMGVNAEFHAAAGEPAESIIRVADRVGADLVVVGNRGMRGVRRILGSVPNAIAHSANCSVLIVDTLTEPGEVDA